MDDNLDTSINSWHNKKFKLQDLYEELNLIKNKYNLTQHNHKFTRFAPHQPPSCIDHIFSNCTNKISNVTTHKNTISDHSIITAQYSSNHQIYHPKFIKKNRNFRLLTKNTLNLYVKNSTLLNSIFNYTDPDIITNLIQLELNTIINFIAPPKIVQFSKNYVPYHNTEIRQNLILKN